MLTSLAKRLEFWRHLEDLENLYRARTKLKSIKMTDLFPGSSYTITTKAKRIYINENLASYHRKIIKKANEKRKDGELLSQCLVT